MKSLYLQTAINAAEAVSPFLAKGFRSNVVANIKPTGINADQVTKFDLAGQKKIISIIKKQFPEHNLFGEEGVDINNGSDYTWVIDPLDGTSNFSRGIPYFAVSIALKHKQELIIGVVALPLENKIVYAEKNQGAFCNGKKISVSKTKNIKQAYIGVGLLRNTDGYQKTLASLTALSKHHTKFRMFGSTASDLAYTAMGSIDVAIIHNVNHWDMAAGVVLIKEAGGKIDIYNNTVLAGNPTILKQIKKST